MKTIEERPDPEALGKRLLRALDRVSLSVPGPALIPDVFSLESAFSLLDQCIDIQRGWVSLVVVNKREQLSARSEGTLEYKVEVSPDDLPCEWACRWSYCLSLIALYLFEAESRRVTG